MPRGGKRPGAGRKKAATPPQETLAVRVPPELLARLEEAAKRAGMPLADYVRRVLNLHGWESASTAPNVQVRGASSCLRCGAVFSVGETCIPCASKRWI